MSMQPHQRLQQLIVYVGLYGTLPYATDLSFPCLASLGICSSGWFVWLPGLELRVLARRWL